MTVSTTSHCTGETSGSASNEEGAEVKWVDHTVKTQFTVKTEIKEEKPTALINGKKYKFIKALRSKRVKIRPSFSRSFRGKMNYFRVLRY